MAPEIKYATAPIRPTKMFANAPKQERLWVRPAINLRRHRPHLPVGADHHEALPRPQRRPRRRRDRPIGSVHVKGRSSCIMPKDETDLTVAFAKQVPVRDALQAPAQQTGQILEDVVKTLHLALAPVQYVAALQDRYRAFLDRAVRRVPEAQRISPPPQILGPVIEGLRYEPEGTPIDEMFQNLLSSAMDADRVENAHPAFPLLIRQLAADEARLLMALAERDLTVIRRADLDRSGQPIESSEVATRDDIAASSIKHPKQVPYYVDHLESLGLVEFKAIDERRANRVKTGNLVYFVEITQVLRLSDFGTLFMVACTGTTTAS